MRLRRIGQSHLAGDDGGQGACFEAGYQSGVDLVQLGPGSVGQPVGVVTSGTQTPFLKKAIGMAYVPPSLKAPGTELEIDIRGRKAKAVVVPLPFYKRPKK